MSASDLDLEAGLRCDVVAFGRVKGLLGDELWYVFLGITSASDGWAWDSDLYSSW